MKNINVVISAAGMGTRLGLDIPKCLVSINGESLLKRQLRQTKECKNVYVVVGFKEELVIKEILDTRKDVIIVRNPQYASTSNAYSLSLGSQFLDNFLALDGDVWFPDSEMNDILETITYYDGQSILFCTEPKTEDGVYMILSLGNECSGFSRETKTPFEWTGCGYYEGIKINRTAKYVFEELEQHLPLKSMMIKCWEVDTPQDLSLLKNLNIDDIYKDKSVVIADIPIAAYKAPCYTLSFKDIEAPVHVTGRGWVIPIKPNNHATNYQVSDKLKFDEFDDTIFLVRGIESFAHKNSPIALCLYNTPYMDRLIDEYNKWNINKGL